jgi:hypothetical protein
MDKSDFIPDGGGMSLIKHKLTNFIKNASSYKKETLENESLNINENIIESILKHIFKLNILGLKEFLEQNASIANEEKLLLVSNSFFTVFWFKLNEEDAIILDKYISLVCQSIGASEKNQYIFSQILAISKIINFSLKEEFLFKYLDFHKEGILFGAVTKASIEIGFKSTYQDIFEADPNSFCQLNKLFNKENKFIKDLMKDFGQVISLTDTFFIIKYCAYLKQCNILTKSVRMELVELLTKQFSELGGALIYGLNIYSSIEKEVNSQIDSELNDKSNLYESVLVLNRKYINDLDDLLSDLDTTLSDTMDQEQMKKAIYKVMLFKRLLYELLFSDDVTDLIKCLHRGKLYLDMESFEKRIREVIKTRLESKKESSSFDTCIPEDIRKKLKEKQLSDKKAGYSERQILDYCEVNNYSSIIRYNWDIFKDVFDSRTTLEENISIINDFRQLFAHSNISNTEDLELKFRGSILYFKKKLGF